MAARLQSHPRYYWFLVAFLVAMSALGSFVNDMYTPALPAMSRFFGCSIPTTQMGLTMGMLGLALGQIILGPVSDRYGRRPVLIGSVALFIVAAVVSVFSPTIHFFIWCRLFQGFGASGGYFLARTIPADVYHGRQLARLMALTGAINGVAPASAPVIGGVTADAFGWQGIFVVLAVFGGLILAMSPWVRESLAPSMRQRGTSLWRSFGGYLVLLRRRPFMTHVWFKGVALGMLFAYISSSPFIFQDHYGLSQTLYGVVIGINSLFVAAGSLVALRFRLLKKAAYTGAILLFAATLCECAELWFIRNLWVYEGCTVVMLFGLGLIFTSANTLAMNEGRDCAGEASSVLGVSGYIVGAIVSPLVGMDNIFHSTALVYLAIATVNLVLGFMLRRLAPDLSK